MPRDPECLHAAPEEPKARAGRRPRPWLAPAAALMAVIVLGLGAVLWDRQRLATGAAPVDARALLRISATPEAVRGPEPSTREPVTMPATIALLASAAARIGDATTARGLADRLMDMSNKDAPGWGLGLPFDAFQDGSVNPPSTIYGTDTAFAAGALLDVFALTGEPRYREIAIQALDRFRRFQIRNAKGLFMAYFRTSRAIASRFSAIPRS